MLFKTKMPSFFMIHITIFLEEVGRKDVYHGETKLAIVYKMLNWIFNLD